MPATNYEHPGHDLRQIGQVGVENAGMRCIGPNGLAWCTPVLRVNNHNESIVHIHCTCIANFVVAKLYSY